MVGIYGAMMDERKTRIWHPWRQGYLMSEIARDIAKLPATVVFLYFFIMAGLSCGKELGVIKFKAKKNLGI